MSENPQHITLDGIECISYKKSWGVSTMPVSNDLRKDFKRLIDETDIIQLHYPYPYTDEVLVTDTVTKEWIEGRYNKKLTHMRTIPSNIFCEGKIIEPKDKNLFVYFGLISKTKAFDEMIKAWTLFNKGKNCRLLILTSSQCELSLEECGVQVIREAEKDSIADYLASAGFCVLPIIPCVSSNNATYKSAIGYNCIPIGVFGKEVGDLSAHINIKDNTVAELQKGLERAFGLNDEERRHYYSTLDKRPKPTFEVTAKEYLEVIYKHK